MFTQDELKNLQVFLGRVQLTGNEALPLVLLQQKIIQLQKPESTKEEEKTEEVKKEE